MGWAVCVKVWGLEVVVEINLNLKCNYFIFCVFFCACNAMAEKIYTNDPQIWDHFKDSEYKNSEKPAIYRKPDEIFFDKNVIKLAEAARKGNDKEIKRLVAAGVDVNAKGWHGLTPIFSALTAKNKAGVKALLEAGANPNDTDNYYGKAAIHMVAEDIENPYFLELILKFGGNPNLPELHGLCGMPLSMAAHRMNSSKAAREKIQILVSAGADLNGVNINCDVSRTAVRPSIALIKALPRYDLIYFMLQLGADAKKISPSGLTLRQAIDNAKNFRMTRDERKWRVKVIELLDGDQKN